MNKIEDILAETLSHTQDEINPQMPEDYIDSDGLLCCGVCHERKQYRLSIGQKQIVVPVICKCREDEIKRQEELEKQRRKDNNIQLLKKLSLISNKYKNASFQTYIVRPENEKLYKIARRYTENFEEMYNNNQGLLLYGPVGTGKSYTAACIANELLNNNIGVVMTSFVKILQDIAPGGMDEGDYIRKLNSAKLLIIDDLGTERSTDYAFEKVYNILDSRIRSNKPMILTTNLTIDYMKSPHDIRYERIYDRIFEVCYPIQVLGSSFRLNEGRRRFTEMKKKLVEEDNGRRSS